ncbi:MAG: hypothetical protein JO085_12705 [Acidimicrobiia bacterium]|nr:hypothetical protein [Acidimicrobiia bacterium]
MPRTFSRVFTAVLGAAVLAAGVGTVAFGLGRYGNDISWPQCGGAFPTKAGFGIVGVNGGVPFSSNPCLAAEWQWAVANKGAPSYYMNIANPGSSDPAGYGASAAAYALSYAASQTGASSAATHGWWIDVETANSWSSNQAQNAAVIQGALTYLKKNTSRSVGVYSTGYQWGVITGGVHLGAPVWAAGASSASSAPSMCGTGFTGQPVKVVQYPAGAYDGDYRC